MLRSILTTAVIAAIATLCSVPLMAQQTNNPSPTQAVQKQNATQVNAGLLDDKTSGTTVRVSEMIGTNLQNDQGESVGEINDLVIDATSGKIRYAAVTYGGFLGVGNKLFAVPFEAFQVRQDPDDAGDYIVVLNVTQEQLKGAQGFDEDRWPDMVNQNWAADLDRRYGIDRNRRGTGVNVDAGRNGVNVDINRNN